MSTGIETRRARHFVAAAMLGMLPGCQAMPLADSANSVVERTEAPPKPARKNHVAKPSSNDTIPDAAEIGLAQQKS